jgi:hypothetical protein
MDRLSERDYTFLARDTRLCQLIGEGLFERIDLRLLDRPALLRNQRLASQVQESVKHLCIVQRYATPALQRILSCSNLRSVCVATWPDSNATFMEPLQRTLNNHAHDRIDIDSFIASHSQSWE